MRRTEYDRAMAIAQDFSVDLLNHQDFEIFGYGLNGFEPVYSSLKGIAEAIRWQCLRMDGTFDGEQEKETRYYFVKCDRVRITGIGSDAWETGCNTRILFDELLERT